MGGDPRACTIYIKMLHSILFSLFDPLFTKLVVAFPKKKSRGLKRRCNSNEVMGMYAWQSDTEIGSPVGGGCFSMGAVVFRLVVVKDGWMKQRNAGLQK